ncbi:unnamed protein product [Macrosiphum euphorbiae]|uniref:Odorant receptor n=1 Tax=Macrosiphum euphorbiae TaxID=13131 RepID=A0AAV0XCM7_9HEMI|nr:unnamed protein product [Macrosiphum euphorbiae]
MDIRDDQNHVFNITLAKCTGIYQMLDPQTIRYRGLNVYHFVVAFLTFYLCVIAMILNVSGVYYWTENLNLSIEYFWKGLLSMYLCYSMCTFIYYSDDIWKCLSITCYGFTSHSFRDKQIILDRWRERSVLFTTILTVMYSTSMMMNYPSSLVLSNVIIPVKNHDGSVSNYRYNLFKLYLFVSDDTYNAHYNIFYIFEALCVISFLILFLLFDILLVTLCLAVLCQMQIVCTACESVGHKSLAGDDLSLVVYWLTFTKSFLYKDAIMLYLLLDCRDEKKQLPNEHELIYDEIKTIIMDHQAVMKKYDTFLTLFKRVVLLQIVVLLMTFIILCICFVMSFSNDDRFKSSRIFTITIFCMVIPNLFKLFAMSYFFGNIVEQKDSIVYALYSSIWTEMDMRCKKLVLLTMKMNNANQKKLKFTRTKIVNLEMFFKTLCDSYSILSVLINCIKNMDE